MAIITKLEKIPEKIWHVAAREDGTIAYSEVMNFKVVNGSIDVEGPLRYAGSNSKIVAHWLRLDEDTTDTFYPSPSERITSGYILLKIHIGETVELSMKPACTYLNESDLDKFEIVSMYEMTKIKMREFLMLTKIKVGNEMKYLVFGPDEIVDVNKAIRFSSYFRYGEDAEIFGLAFLAQNKRTDFAAWNVKVPADSPYRMDLWIKNRSELN